MFKETPLPDALSLAEIARRTCLGRTSVYNAMRSGDLKTVRIGQTQTIRVFKADYLAWLASWNPTNGEAIRPKRRNLHAVSA